MKENLKTLYSSRRWLNHNDSPSTGSLVCYDGFIKDENESESTHIAKFVVTDCYATVKLHLASYDSIEDFVAKLCIIRNETDKFIKHLIENHNIDFLTDKKPKQNEQMD